jgi:segregation and condensation protein A
MQDRIYEMLIQKDEITWQSIIYDLVKSEQMDPWDIDISLLSKRYLETIKVLKEHNFFISGKMILASAILLKLKSHKLLNEYIAEFDNYLFSGEESLLDYEEPQETSEQEIIPGLLIKTPQPRKGKVNLDDLINALKKALNVENRRVIRRSYEKAIQEAKIPEKRYDIGLLIKNVYDKIVNLFESKKTLTFNELVNSNRKEDKILTFVPLLHLSNQNKVDINQEEHFGDIYIDLIKGGKNENY